MEAAAAALGFLGNKKIVNGEDENREGHDSQKERMGFSTAKNSSHPSLTSSTRGNLYHGDRGLEQDACIEEKDGDGTEKRVRGKAYEQGQKNVVGNSLLTSGGAITASVAAKPDRSVASIKPSVPISSFATHEEQAKPNKKTKKDQKTEAISMHKLQSIIKRAVPKEAIVPSEVKEVLQKLTLYFAYFLLDEILDTPEFTKGHLRGEMVLKALDLLGFHEYATLCSAYRDMYGDSVLQRMKELTGSRKSTMPKRQYKEWHDQYLQRKYEKKKTKPNNQNASQKESNLKKNQSIKTNEAKQNLPKKLSMKKKGGGGDETSFQCRDDANLLGKTSSNGQQKKRKQKEELARPVKKNPRSREKVMMRDDQNNLNRGRYLNTYSHQNTNSGFYNQQQLQQLQVSESNIAHGAWKDQHRKQSQEQLRQTLDWRGVNKEKEQQMQTNLWSYRQSTGKWRKAQDKGKIYYFNTISRVTQWERPEAYHSDSDPGSTAVEAKVFEYREAKIHAIDEAKVASAQDDRRLGQQQEQAWQRSQIASPAHTLKPESASASTANRY
mmetsp:Transcript_35152/g.59561  ORF Transcript_35152/g.59561 Transcript_35152/m.59561 type:complete len:552 (-) Transcript_35152:63-1718(-)